ncbi:MAG: hydroxyphenylacetyl-CoA thioesterase PaaI [Woeseiaceae bacterium]
MEDLELARRCAERMLSDDAASRALGISIDIPAAGRAIGRMSVRDDMVNGFDVCHGGLIFTLADTAFAFACNSYDRLTLAAAASIDFIRPAKLGDVLQATAGEEYRGAKNGFYTVEVRNQKDELVAMFRGRSGITDKPILQQSDTKNIENSSKA